MPSRSASALRTKLDRGHEVTLVLGAGVSLARGIPGWGALAATVCSELRVPVPASLGTSPGAIHPLALPIAFELAEQRTVGSRGHKGGPSFVEALRRGLYANVRDGQPHDSTVLLAELIRDEQKRDRRRIRRVITFNADDLLERAANVGHSPNRAPVVWPITSESARPRMDRGAHGRSPIPIYHIHGFIPQTGSPYLKHEAADYLVFTERQYWASFAEPTSFPNRVVMGALHDSVCIFLGLSMTDLNLARWLGMRASAIERDSQRKGRSAAATRRFLDHHFWIRRTPSPDSPEEFVTEVLRARGVLTIDLEAWGEPFAQTVRHVFAT